MTRTDLRPAVLVEPAARRQRKRRATAQRGLVWLVAPSVTWYVIFTIGPLVAMFWIALLDWPGLLADSTFVGFDNFVRMWNDGKFWQSGRNTIVHLVVSLPIMMVVSFMIGYYLNLRPPGHRVLRVLMFVPALISISALGVMFLAILGPNGLVNAFLGQIGQDSWKLAWLADKDTALASIIVVTLWGGIGFNAVLFAARLAAVPDEIYEAAQLDGCSHWHAMWRVAFPVVQDYFGVLTMLQYLWNLFGSAGVILLLTRGGPEAASSTLSWMVYENAFLTTRIGYSQAIGVVLFVFGMLGLLAIRAVLRARY
jgi:ABC-type sugar transport system permease subunit